MNNVVLLALIATVITWLITSLGSATVVFFNKDCDKQMNLALGFAAGVMIAASFWSLLQPAIETAARNGGVPPWLAVGIGFISGAVFMWGSDKAVTYSREKSGKGDGTRFNRIMMTVTAITLHNIPEGLAIGVAFGSAGISGSRESIMGAVSIAVGIGIQNFPEGAAVSLPLRREGYSAFKSFIVGQASGLVEPIAGVLGAVAAVRMNSVMPYTLSFAAGAMILVAVHELIPECRRNLEENPYIATMGIVAGFTVMMVLDTAL